MSPKMGMWGGAITRHEDGVSKHAGDKHAPEDGVSKRVVRSRVSAATSWEPRASNEEL